MTAAEKPAPPTLTAVRYGEPIHMTWHRASRQPVAYSAHVHLPCSRCGGRFWHALAVERVRGQGGETTFFTDGTVTMPTVCPACAVPWWRRMLNRLRSKP